MFVKHSPSRGSKRDHPVAVGNTFTKILEPAASEKHLLKTCRTSSGV